MHFSVHPQSFMDTRALPEVMPKLKDRRLPVVLDHFGAAKAAEGTSGSGFQVLRRLLTDGLEPEAEEHRGTAELVLDVDQNVDRHESGL